jgi:hypothetical protein
MPAGLRRQVPADPSPADKSAPVERNRQPYDDVDYGPEEGRVTAGTIKAKVGPPPPRGDGARQSLAEA